MKTELYPNCSEYVTRINLTAEELKKAKKMALKFNLPKDEYKLLCQHLKDGGNETSTFGDFIEMGLERPYEYIKNEIKEDRKKAFLKRFLKRYKPGKQAKKINALNNIPSRRKK